MTAAADWKKREADFERAVEAQRDYSEARAKGDGAARAQTRVALMQALERLCPLDREIVEDQAVGFGKSGPRRIADPLPPEQAVWAPIAWLKCPHCHELTMTEAQAPQDRCRHCWRLSRVVARAGEEDPA